MRILIIYLKLKDKSNMNFPARRNYINKDIKLPPHPQELRLTSKYSAIIHSGILWWMQAAPRELGVTAGQCLVWDVLVRKFLSENSLDSYQLSR